MSTKYNLKKILIIRLSSIGDVVLSTHLPRMLKNNLSLVNNLQIDFLTSNSIASLFKYNSIYSNILKFNGKNLQLLNTQIQNEQYDLIIDLQKNKLSSDILSNYTGEVRRIKKYRKEKLEMVYFKKFPTNVTHVANRYLNTCRDLIFDDGLGLELHLRNKSFLNKRSKKHRIVGIAPEAFHKTKRWQKEKYEKLIQLLIKDGYRIRIFGSNDSTLSITSESVENNCGKLSLYETAESISECDYFISNDTGLMHIASAFQIPILLIFGSSVKELGFTPFRVSYEIVEKDLWCRPCSHIGKSFCPLGHFKCMSEITTNEVYQRFKSFIANE